MAYNLPLREVLTWILRIVYCEKSASTNNIKNEIQVLSQARILSSLQNINILTNNNTSGI